MSITRRCDDRHADDGTSAIYGVLRGDLVVIAGNSATLLLVSSVVLVKARRR